MAYPGKMEGQNKMTYKNCKKLHQKTMRKGARIREITAVYNMCKEIQLFINQLQIINYSDSLITCQTLIKPILKTLIFSFIKITYNETIIFQIKTVRQIMCL